MEPRNKATNHMHPSSQPTLYLFLCYCLHYTPLEMTRCVFSPYKLDLEFSLFSLACCWLKPMHRAAFNLAVRGNSFSPQLPVVQAQGLESKAWTNSNGNASNEFKCIAAKQCPLLFFFFSFLLHFWEIEMSSVLPVGWDSFQTNPHLYNRRLLYISQAFRTFWGVTEKSIRDSAAAKRKELMALFCASSIWCTERGRTPGFWGRRKRELWEIFIWIGHF